MSYKLLGPRPLPVVVRPTPLIVVVACLDYLAALHTDIVPAPPLLILLVGLTSTESFDSGVHWLHLQQYSTRTTVSDRRDPTSSVSRDRV